MFQALKLMAGNTKLRRKQKGKGKEKKGKRKEGITTPVRR